jgi:hypothetical protein
MAEEGKNPAVATRRKKNNYNQFGGRPFPQSKSPCTSNVAEIKDDTFHAGSSSDPAKYSKLLKSIETYIHRTYKMPDDIVKEIQNRIRLSFDPPEKLDKSKCLDHARKSDPDVFEMAKFTCKEDWKLMKSRKQKYEENEVNAWALVYNQCSNELRVKLEGTSGYELCKKENKVIVLLTMIRGHCCQFDALNNEYVDIVMAVKNLLYCFQKPAQSNSDYQEDFLAMVEVIKEYREQNCSPIFPI